MAGRKKLSMATRWGITRRGALITLPTRTFLPGGVGENLAIDGMDESTSVSATST